MRPTLIFPPQANPTYVPIGIAALNAVAPSHLADLNIAAWREILASVPGGEKTVAFMRGEEDNFFNRYTYEDRRAALALAEAKLSAMGQGLSRWLKTGERGFAVDFAEKLISPALCEAPLLLGFSVFSLGQLPWALAMAKIAREKLGKEARILLGGAAMGALFPEELVAACPFLDGVVSGEGEEPFRAISRGEPNENIPGLTWMGENGTITKKPGWERDIALTPPPDYTGLDITAYLNPEPVFPILLSRGCKWRRCRFCAHNSSYGGYRKRLFANVALEMLSLERNFGARHFYFGDLYVDAPELDELSDEIIRLGAKPRFHILGRPGPGYTPQILRKAYKAGLRWISWGVESGSQRLLKLSAKGTTPAGIAEAISNASDAGISSLMMMIYGLPTSGAKDLDETFSMIDRLYHKVDAFTASPFALFTTARFYKNPGKYGLTPLQRHVELWVGENPVHSARVDFLEEGESGKRPPGGEVEADLWRQRRRWLGEVPFIETLSCEHYLLWVSREREGRPTPTFA